ncbi:phage tail assembly protein [Nitratireductor sp. GISD-1A_MAKvit]|uniref:phage tail assembly protein n=1 Tax=Nitratireductor sp. GISD-1A_MAKvit TaxID=3234198 RepID=UPI003467836A
MAKNANTVTLATPVTVNGLPLNEITLRPLKVRDLVKANREGGDDFEKSLNLLAAASDLDRSAIDEIDITDLEALNAAMDSLLGKSALQANGST